MPFTEAGRANTVTEILKELLPNAREISQAELNQAANMISGADQNVFCMGAGRSGAIVRAFANRILHLGKHVYMVGDSTTPPVRKGDLIVVISGSGKSASLLQSLEIAKSMGAEILILTMNPDSPAGKLATLSVRIPGTTRQADQPTAESFQPVGNLFEQLAWLTADAIIILAKEKLNLSNEDLLARHANIE